LFGLTDVSDVVIDFPTFDLPGDGRVVVKIHLK
jgi:hypothetical protein